jgi:hypothetical protein
VQCRKAIEHSFGKSLFFKGVPRTPSEDEVVAKAGWTIIPADRDIDAFFGDSEESQ